MTTWIGQAEVAKDGTIQIVVPSNLPPGPVNVEVHVHEGPAANRPDWDRLYGLGKEIWQGTDAERYLRELRQDRETQP